jgi:hypothetical protein
VAVIEPPLSRSPLSSLLWTRHTLFIDAVDTSLCAVGGPPYGALGMTTAILAYAVYGLVLGSGYDHLAAHRTFL